MSELNINCVTVRFGGLTAVNEVDFCVKPGEICALIGPNGAGKTTVFNAITGVYEPSAGNITFAGAAIQRKLTPRSIAGFLLAGLAVGFGLVLVLNVEALWTSAITGNYVYQQPFPWGKVPGAIVQCLREQPLNYTVGAFVFGTLLGAAGVSAMWMRSRRTPDFVSSSGIARTFQNIRLFPEMTAVENVMVGMHTGLRSRLWHAAFRLPLYWREQKAALARAREVLEFAGLAAHENTVADAMAYGHQRLLEIARALASNPKVLLLDEPAAGMNPSETADLMVLIRKIRDTGISVLLIEHDMKLVMGVSDRVVVLDYGNKIAEGTPHEVRNNPKVTAAYLGEPEPA